MIAWFLIGVGIGLIGGVAIGRRRRKTSESGREISEALKAHKEAVQERVSSLADDLAGSDVVLRAQLSRFEEGIQ